MRLPIISTVVTVITAITAISAVPGLALAGDWSGAYVGGQIGMIRNASGAGAGTGSDEVRYGVHGGYAVALGRLVLGGEIEIERFDLLHAPSGQRLGTVGRLKFRAGGDFGRGMAYAVVGGVNGETALGHETGFVYGLGLAASLRDGVTVSGEALRQVFDNFAGSGSDLQSDSFNVRVSFRF